MWENAVIMVMSSSLPVELKVQRWFTYLELGTDVRSSRDKIELNLFKRVFDLQRRKVAENSSEGANKKRVRRMQNGFDTLDLFKRLLYLQRRIRYLCYALCPQLATRLSSLKIT